MNKATTALFISLVLLSTPSLATNIQFNGFASIIAGFTTDEIKPDIAQESLTNVYRLNYDDNISFNNESLFALQAIADLKENWSVTGLMLAKGEDDFETDMFAAYASYQVNQHWRVNLGRIPWPLFQYSDYINVGYSYPWISPPSGVYDLSTTNNLDGITSIHEINLADWYFTLQPYSDFDTLFGTRVAASYHWIHFNTVYVRNTDNTIPLFIYDIPADSLINDGFTRQGNSLKMEKDAGDFFSFGFNADYDNWLLIGEYARVDFDLGWFSDFEAYYLTLGRRFDDLTLHITYDIQQETPQLEFTKGLPSDYPVDSPFSPNAHIPLSVVENQVRGRAQDYTNIIIGARYDFHPSAAIKVEYLINNTDDGDKTIGEKEFEQNLVRFALDLVF